jgi:hypothetical protein
LTAALIIAGAGAAGAQGRGGAQQLSPWAAAPIDLTGYWVAVISEDWRWRMVTPARGDHPSIPLTQAGKDLAETWDPARDVAAGEQCKGYGAPGLMRAPTRLHITWIDDRTLKVESDYGMQTRLLHFAPGPSTPLGAGKPAGGAPSWQGDSTAQWEGSLRAVTTNLRPGYLRKNGVPYSANTTLTEFFDVFTHRSGDRWLVVTSRVHDPENLQTDWITSLNFKREPNGARWDPTPCSATW